MIQPVAPGPVTKLALRNATNLAPPVFAEVSAMASLAKLTMCAHVHGGAGDDRPGGGLMESEVLVKGDDLVEGSATEGGR
jgi:hypothetical protein